MIRQRPFAVFGIAAILCFLSIPAHADTKIGAINFDDVVRSSPQYKAADTKITQEFGKRKSDLEAQAKQFSDDAAKYTKDRDVLSADARDKTEKDLNQRQVDLQYAQKKLQEDFSTRNQELLQQMIAQIRAVVIQVSKDKGYTLVVSNPVYADDAVDISAEVLNRLNAAPATK